MSERSRGSSFSVSKFCAGTACTVRTVRKLKTEEGLARQAKWMRRRKRLLNIAGASMRRILLAKLIISKLT